MGWETLTWRPADASTVDDLGSLPAHAPLIRSALEEAASALLMGAVTIASIEAANVDAPAALPDGFEPVATFELLGTVRRPLLAALDPSGADRLAGTSFDPAALARELLGGLNDGIEAVVSEGIQVGPADAAALHDDEALVLVRLGLEDAEGGRAMLVFAVDAAVPAELSTHVTTLEALGPAAHAAEQPVASPEGDALAPETDALAPDGLPAVPADGSPFPSAYPGAGGPSGAFVGPGYAAASGFAAGAGAQAAPAGPAFPGAPGYAGAPGAYPPNVRPFALDELGGGPAAAGGGAIDLLFGVNLQVTVEIGRARLPIRDVLALTPGSIVELDKLAGEKVDVLVNGHLIASGEVVVVDENFGVRITEVSARARRLAAGEGAA